MINSIDFQKKGFIMKKVMIGLLSIAGFISLTTQTRDLNLVLYNNTGTNVLYGENFSKKIAPGTTQTIIEGAEDAQKVPNTFKIKRGNTEIDLTNQIKGAYRVLQGYYNPNGKNQDAYINLTINPDNKITITSPKPLDQQNTQFTQDRWQGPQQPTQQPTQPTPSAPTREVKSILIVDNQYKKPVTVTYNDSASVTVQPGTKKTIGQLNGIRSLSIRTSTSKDKNLTTKELSEIRYLAQQAQKTGIGILIIGKNSDITWDLATDFKY